MKKSLFLSVIMISTLGAWDMRVGKGTYDTNMDISSFMSHDTTHDTTVFTLSQAHEPLKETKLFYYLQAEFLSSDTKRQETRFANVAADFNFPLIGSINDNTNSFIDMFPVDADYQAIGFDFDVGVGYDVWRKGESYLGLALNVGATLPTIDATNLSSKVDFAYDMIDSWDLKMNTYKIGPAIKGNYVLSDGLSLYGSFSLGFQKANIKSGLFKSSIDVDGSYNALDIGLGYALKDSPYYFQVGHSVKSWEVDSANVNLYNFFEADVLRPFDISLKSSQTYVGVGYRF